MKRSRKQLDLKKKNNNEVMKMDHVVYVDAKAKEMDKLTSGEKNMIIRSAAGRKLPYGRVNDGDILYFINNNAEGKVKAKAVVKSVLNSDKLTKEQSINLVTQNQEKLKLTDKQFKRWSGKRYIVLVELENIEEVKPFAIDKSNYGNMDDWLPVGDIKKIIV
ncbi:MAG: hypothetical protein ACOCVD_02805 [Bacillota bacterium]